MNSIVLELKSLNHCVCRRVEKNAKKYGITGVQFLVLTYLLHNEDKDVYQKDIEKFIDVRGSTATVLLQTLTQNGFIKRESIPHDARLKKIVLCDKAKCMVNDFESEMKNLQTEIEKNISEEEKENFINIVEKVKKNLEN